MKKINKKKLITTNKLYIAFLIFLIFAIFFYLYYRYEILNNYTNQISYINKKIEKATKENEELNAKREYKDSMEYVEKLARDNLGMVKNNEIIFYDTK